MGFGDIHGRASVDANAPTAFGVCDDCGEWYNLSNLRWQLEYRGLGLARTGFRKCPSCMDVPQPQLKPVIIPTPDPKPVLDARPENFYADMGLQGFTQYITSPADNPLTVKADVLAAIAELSGIDTPLTIVDRSGSIALGTVGQQAMAANALRTWLLVYNPAVTQLGLSLTTASFGGMTTISIGPGEGLFWADAQDLAATTKSAIAVVGLLGEQPFYAWEAP